MSARGGRRRGQDPDSHRLRGWGWLIWVVLIGLFLWAGLAAGPSR
ncbi:hypothetical protein ACWGB8_13885 [Kitasatospora sp. NPDC054939]